VVKINETDSKKIEELDVEIKKHEQIRDYIVGLLETITTKEKQILDLKYENRKLLQTITLVRDIIK
jgi:hypothetical protein